LNAVANDGKRHACSFAPQPLERRHVFDFHAEMDFPVTLTALAQMRRPRRTMIALKS
jgi:hypothetical protein